MYKFRVAAWNIYGLGKFSEQLVVNYGKTLHEKLEISVARQPTGFLRIEWTGNKNLETEYEVKIFS